MTRWLDWQTKRNRRNNDFRGAASTLNYRSSLSVTSKRDNADCAPSERNPASPPRLPIRWSPRPSSTNRTWESAARPGWGQGPSCSTVDHARELCPLASYVRTMKSRSGHLSGGAQEEQVQQDRVKTQNTRQALGRFGFRESEPKRRQGTPCSTVAAGI